MWVGCKRRISCGKTLHGLGSDTAQLLVDVNIADYEYRDHDDLAM